MTAPRIRIEAPKTQGKDERKILVAVRTGTDGLLYAVRADVGVVLINPVSLRNVCVYCCNILSTPRLGTP